MPDSHSAVLSLVTWIDVAIVSTSCFGRYDPFGVDVPLNFDNTHSHSHQEKRAWACRLVFLCTRSSMTMWRCSRWILCNPTGLREAAAPSRDQLSRAPAHLSYELLHSQDCGPVEQTPWHYHADRLPIVFKELPGGHHLPITARRQPPPPHCCDVRMEIAIIIHIQISTILVIVIMYQYTLSNTYTVWFLYMPFSCIMSQPFNNWTGWSL